MNKSSKNIEVLDSLTFPVIGGKTRNLRVALIACCFSLFAFVSRADSFPSVNNGVLTLNIEEGTTIVFTDPLPAEATSIIKKGGGTATLSVASTSYTGPIDIQKGTLKLTDKDAAGTGSKITVSGEAATLFLNFDNPAGDRQDLVFFPGHDLTIRGKGVGEQGAFRFEAPTTWACDSALDTLTLSGDAYIAIVTRFGVANKIKLNGHSLTRVGDANGAWMFFDSNCEIDKGIISNTVGQVTIQNVPVFLNPAETTLAMTGGGLMFWASKPDLPCRIVSNVKIWEEAYDGPGNNVISGPIEFIGDHDYEVKSGHQMEFRGEMTASGKFTKVGSGNLYLDGPFESSKELYIRGGGGALICSSNVTRKVSALVLNESGARFDLRGGTMNGGWIRVANGWCIASVLQSGGEFIARGDTYIGEASSSYGAWMMSGGTATFNDKLYICSNPGSEGVIWQTGGRIKTGNYGFVGRSGRGFLGVFNGAVNDTRVAWYGSGETLQLGSEAGGRSAVAVTGEGSVLTTESVIMGSSGNVSTNILVVADGGTVKARRFYRKGDVGAESLNEVYFDGGVIYPTFGWGWTHHGGNEPEWAPDYWVLGPKGMIVDTSEIEADSHEEGELNHYSEWAHKLIDLSGRGIATIELPADNEEFSKQTYYGPAFVDIEGPAGSHGAMAMAEVDPAANKLTRIVVFAPGSGYDETTKVYVRSAVSEGRFECNYTLTEKRAGGKLIKRGKQRLFLYAANTYTGGTIVEGGKLVMINEKTFPENTPLKVVNGGEFSNNLKPITVSVLGGVDGKITDFGGTMNVTKALEITVAELFASNGPLQVAGTIQFADGVEIRITDPENLPKFKNEKRRKFLTAEGGFEGKIPEVTMVAGGRLWSVDCVGNSLTLGPDRSSKIIIR